MSELKSPSGGLSPTSSAASDIVARSREALRVRDAAAFVQLYADDAEIVGPGGRVARGADGARRFFERNVSRPRVEFEVETESVDGSIVTLEGKAYARMAAGRVAAAARERKLVARFIETFVVDDGLICTHKLFLDENYRAAPWEIGRPQSSVVKLANDGFLTGRVLDVGCGTGENALFLAGLGRDVVGIDAARFAIEKARTTARRRGLEVAFVCGDATALQFPDGRFDNVFDSGLLHVLREWDYESFTGGLHRVLRLNGRHHVLCLNEHASMRGPRRFKKAELESLFTDGWVVESIEETTFDINVGTAPPGAGASAWLATVRRV